FQGFVTGYDKQFPDASIELNKWHHIAISLQNHIVTLYLDGMKLDTFAIALNTVGSVNDIMQLGDFNGYIDELLVYDRALNDAEIRDIYNFTLGCDITITPTPAIDTNTCKDVV